MEKLKQLEHGSAASRWSAVNDHLLLEVEFVHGDPEKLENLLDAVPETEEVPEIEFSYDTTKTGNAMVRCRHCKKTAANHNRGFVLRYSDGTRVLFGKDCGAKQFGEHFVFKEKQFHAARKRAELLKRQRHILGCRRAALDLVEAIEGYAGWRDYGLAKRSYRDGLWFAVSALTEAINRQDGGLYRTEEVRDFGAEERREQAGRKRGGPIYKEVKVKLGTLSGQSFFAATGKLPEKVVPDLARRLKATIFSIEDVDSNRDLELKFKGIDSILTELRMQMDLVEDIHAALTHTNLDLMMQWMEASGMGHFRRKDKLVYRYDAADNVVAVLRGESRIPAKFSACVPLAAPPFEALRELGNILRI